MDKIIRLANENLKDLIERLCPGIRFERIGKALKAKCPFFSEGETRFYLWPEKNCWVTYGDIRAHGDAVGFVSRLRACGKAQAISEIERLFAPADTGLKAKTEKVSPVEDYEFEENDHFIYVRQPGVQFFPCSSDRMGGGAYSKPDLVEVYGSGEVL